MKYGRGGGGGGCVCVCVCERVCGGGESLLDTLYIRKVNTEAGDQSGRPNFSVCRSKTLPYLTPLHPSEPTVLTQGLVLGSGEHSLYFPHGITPGHSQKVLKPNSGWNPLIPDSLC